MKRRPMRSSRLAHRNRRSRWPRGSTKPHQGQRSTSHFTRNPWPPVTDFVFQVKDNGTYASGACPDTFSFCDVGSNPSGMSAVARTFGGRDFDGRGSAGGVGKRPEHRVEGSAERHGYVDADYLGESRISDLADR